MLCVVNILNRSENQEYHEFGIVFLLKSWFSDDLRKPRKPNFDAVNSLTYAVRSKGKSNVNRLYSIVLYLPNIFVFVVVRINVRINLRKWLIKTTH